MQKRSESGIELSHLKTDPQDTKPTVRGQAFFVDGQLDVDAYFDFLEDYQKLFPKNTTRPPIPMHMVKL